MPPRPRHRAADAPGRPGETRCEAHENSHPRTSRLEALAGLRNSSVLDVGRTEISDAGTLSQLGNSEDVAIEETKVTALPPLPALQRLTAFEHLIPVISRNCPNFAHVAIDFLTNVESIRNLRTMPLFQGALRRRAKRSFTQKS
jgi:hypothetical protein